jgi:hypothetical protein
MAPIWPHDDGTARTSAVAAIASVARAIRRQRPHHGQHRLRDHDDGCAFQPVQPAAAKRVAERGDAIAEQHQRDRRRHREAGPGGERARIAGARQAERDADLAARRAGQELRQRHQVDVSLFVEPFAAHDEFLVEIAEMSDRAAEARQSEPQKRGKNFSRTAAARSRICRRAGWFLHGSHC